MYQLNGMDNAATSCYGGLRTSVGIVSVEDADGVLRASLNS